MKKICEILLIVLISIIVVGAIVLGLDYIRVSKQKEPLFGFSKYIYNSEEVNNGNNNVQSENKSNINKVGINNTTNNNKKKNEINYTKITEANLTAEGVSTQILVRYNNTLYGKSFAIIDYAGNPQASEPIRKNR